MRCHFQVLNVQTSLRASSESTRRSFLILFSLFPPPFSSDPLSLFPCSAFFKKETEVREETEGKDEGYYRSSWTRGKSHQETNGPI